MNGLINARVISFIVIATMPLWMCLIAGIVVMIEQKLGILEVD